MYVPLEPAQTSILPLVSTNTMPAFEPELTMPYRVLLGRSPLGMGPNRRELPLYVTLYTLTMTTLPLTSYVMPDWSVATFDSESWDTESLLDIEDGYCRFRVAPSVMVWDEVHKGNPCVGIVDNAAFRKGEAAIMIARKADNTEGFVSFHRYVDNLLQCPTVRRARLRDREVL